MKSSFLFYFFMAACTLLIVSCRSTKKIQEAIVRKDTAAVVIKMPTREDTAKLVSGLLENVNKQHIAYQTFSAKIKVNYTNSKGKQPDFFANLRMKKDSIIWVSLSNDLGIEGIRIMILRDSVHMLDKLANTYEVRPLSYIQEISQIPFTMQEIQELLVGNPVFFRTDSITSYSQNSSGYTLLSVDTLFKNLLTINNAFLIEKSKLDDQHPALNRTCDLLFSDFENKTGLWFSTSREINILQESRLEVQLKFKDYRFQEPLTYPFAIPKKIKRKLNTAIQ